MLGPYDYLWEQFSNRVVGLTDEEYFREPVPGCWSVRLREESTAPRKLGRGDWVLEEGRRVDPPPFTTIAWRLCHICVSPLLRHDYTFGSHTLTMDDILWPGSAQEAVEFLKETHHRWRNALATLDPADAVKVGLSQMPYGLDPDVRFIDLVAWTNTEFAHHAAEIACLRDLYQTARRQREGSEDHEDS